ncbi:hypothetical protein BDV95DRAFT_590376 [Massariosphaeria phaeospora]|uniref:Uncharacterized protein n=1 Tax=Massariosphaeria phaeospora TaxID=100035 RepID=A0A7C8MSZ3_9PLEO|nr:hypothetical protein BDV95DRAFT_590376 [Massariosphaeria phaeospora]
MNEQRVVAWELIEDVDEIANSLANTTAICLGHWAQLWATASPYPSAGAPKSNTEISPIILLYKGFNSGVFAPATSRTNEPSHDSKGTTVSEASHDDRSTSLVSSTKAEKAGEGSVGTAGDWGLRGKRALSLVASVLGEEVELLAGVLRRDMLVAARRRGASRSGYGMGWDGRRR